MLQGLRNMLEGIENTLEDIRYVSVGTIGIAEGTFTKLNHDLDSTVKRYSGITTAVKSLGYEVIQNIAEFSENLKRQYAEVIESVRSKYAGSTRAPTTRTVEQAEENIVMPAQKSFVPANGAKPNASIDCTVDEPRYTIRQRASAPPSAQTIDSRLNENDGHDFLIRDYIPLEGDNNSSSSFSTGPHIPKDSILQLTNSYRANMQGIMDRYKGMADQELASPALTMARILSGKYEYLGDIKYSGQNGASKPVMRTAWRWSDRIRVLEDYVRAKTFSVEDIDSIMLIQEALSRNRYLRKKHRNYSRKALEITHTILEGRER